MKQATKSDLYKAMTRLFNLKGDVNLDNLQIIMDYFHEELVQEYNEEHADTRGYEEYDGSDFNAKFDQWACDRITFLFQN